MKSITTKIDGLAAATQREFTAIRQEIATKDDVRIILLAIENVDVRLSSYASRWSDEFDSLEGRTTEIDDRVRFLEKQGDTTA